LPLYSLGATGSTATITGKVTIENDFTNTKTEVPQNITLKANFASNLTGSVTGSTDAAVNITSYTFNVAGIGSAAVDNTTGNYTMKVPSTAAGVTYTLIIPEIEGSVTMAGSTVNGLPANGQPAPQIFPAAMLSATDGAAQWGPLVGTYDAIPSVTGVKAVFSTPPSPGAGLTFNMTALSRPLSTTDGINGTTWDTFAGFGSGPVNAADQTKFEVGETVYQLTSRGSGYTASPAITVNGVNTNALFKASIRGFLTSIGASGGTGYTTGAATVSIQITDNATVPNTITVATAPCQITATSGAITAVTLPSGPVAWASTGNSSGSSAFNVVSINATVTQGGGSGASFTPSWNTEIDHIMLEKAGTGYSSVPTIAFAAGSVSTATLVVKEFRTQWSVALSNSANTTPYSILPKDITFQYNQLNAGVVTSKNVMDQFNNSVDINANIVASAGTVIQKDLNEIYRTAKFSASKPQALITASESVTTQATVTVATDGTITSIALPASSAATYGKGYSTPPTVTIQPMVTGAPGSGAVVDLSSVTTFDPVTGEYKLSSSATVTPLVKGSGYVGEVNQILTTLGSNTSAAFAPVPPSAGIQATVKTGETAVINIDYGSGRRKQKIK